MTTGEWYRRFAVHEAAGLSPTYERLAMAVAGASDLLAALDALPERQRQPNLVFAAARLLGSPLEDRRSFLAWIEKNWAQLTGVLAAKRTQTNEAGRCASLLPLLSRIEGPIALLEVGAAAGLCLYPDRWRYRYGAEVIGDPSAPLLVCEPVGAFTAPTRLPEVIWRAGLDLNPLDVTNDDDAHWLEVLVWPEQHERLERLRAAVQLARADPPTLVRGDLNDDLLRLVAQAPSDATLVVMHSAVLTYLSAEERRRFVDQVTALPGHWISNEGPSVLPSVAARLPADQPLREEHFLTALDGHPLAWSGPHGQSIELLP